MKNATSQKFYKNLRHKLIDCRVACGRCYEQISQENPCLSPHKIFKMEYSNAIKNISLDTLYSYLHSLDCDIDIKITQHIKR